MDLKTAADTGLTIASQASKGALHAVWTRVALRPRTATVAALGLILAAFIGGVAVGGSL